MVSGPPGQVALAAPSTGLATPLPGPKAAGPAGQLKEVQLVPPSGTEPLTPRNLKVPPELTVMPSEWPPVLPPMKLIVTWLVRLFCPMKQASTRPLTTMPVVLRVRVVSPRYRVAPASTVIVPAVAELCTSTGLGQ